MNPVLQFQNVSKQFGSVHALMGVNLVVPQASVLALLGPNGAGKSTLFGCLLGFIQPSSGEILFRDRSMREDDRRRFGYVAERVTLYAHRTVWENGLFFARLRRIPAGDFAKQLQRVGLTDVRNRKAHQLSKGMLQRLGLAIALAGQPELLVLDEPFNGLDPLQLDELQNILRSEHERGATLLISTHTMSAIEPLASHVAIMLDGSLTCMGTLDELRTRYADESSLEAIYHRIARAHHRTPLPDAKVIANQRQTGGSCRHE